MRKQCFSENGSYFDIIWAWEQCVFWENRRIFDKIWACEHWFFREESDKDHLIDFFGPYNSVVLAELTFFDQIWVWQQGVFHAKFETNDSCFCEKGCFLTKYGHESIVFFRERTFSVKNGHESNNFQINDFVHPIEERSWILICF